MKTRARTNTIEAELEYIERGYKQVETRNGGNKLG